MYEHNHSICFPGSVDECEVCRLKRRVNELGNDREKLYNKVLKLEGELNKLKELIRFHWGHTINGNNKES